MTNDTRHASATLTNDAKGGVAAGTYTFDNAGTHEIQDFSQLTFTDVAPALLTNQTKH